VTVVEAMEEVVRDREAWEMAVEVATAAAAWETATAAAAWAEEVTEEAVWAAVDWVVAEADSEVDKMAVEKA
jgi:hypothetical protein